MTLIAIKVLFGGTATVPVVPSPKTNVSVVIFTLTATPPFSTVNSTTVPIGNATLEFAGMVYVRTTVSATG